LVPSTTTVSLPLGWKVKLLAVDLCGAAIWQSKPGLTITPVRFCGGQLLAASSAGATSALIVVLAEGHRGVTGSGYGLLIGAIGIGAALGPLALLRPTASPAAHCSCLGSFACAASSTWWATPQPRALDGSAAHPR
jgi:hypothetical protein